MQQVNAVIRGQVFGSSEYGFDPTGQRVIAAVNSVV